MKVYTTPEQCTARLVELLLQETECKRVEDLIQNHESAPADIQAVSLSIIMAAVKPLNITDFTNIVRCAVEAAWGLGYRAAEANAQQQALADWQVVGVEGQTC